jgi:hypothetical protein
VADIREAQRIGVHVQLCHEFPRVIDPGSAHAAIEFEAIVDARRSLDPKRCSVNVKSYNLHTSVTFERSCVPPKTHRIWNGRQPPDRLISVRCTAVQSARPGMATAVEPNV